MENTFVLFFKDVIWPITHHIQNVVNRKVSELKYQYTFHKCCKNGRWKTESISKLDLLLVSCGETEKCSGEDVFWEGKNPYENNPYDKY